MKLMRSQLQILDIAIFFGPEEATSLTIGGINIFDEDPPEVQTFIGFDVQTHDPRGRMLYVSLSHNF